ncbi:MAG: peptidylprolyl isomerase [Coriobacteriales bacterium]
MRDESRLGKYALIRYKGGALGEEPVEDYSTGEPQRVRIGYAEVPNGIDDVLFEMEVGESGTVVISPDKAYGYHDPEGVQIRMRKSVPDGDALEVGSVLGWRSPITHQVLPVRVIEATDDYLKLDYNHPLAGKSLEYWIELVDIVAA